VTVTLATGKTEAFTQNMSGLYVGPANVPDALTVYFAEMDHIITQLGLDMARQRESFARQWHVAEVRIITMPGEDIGWL
jgi:hypothetical protein